MSAVLQFILFGSLTDMFPFIKRDWLRIEDCFNLVVFDIETRNGLRFWIVKHNIRGQGNNTAINVLLRHL
jgi:hypothetical protein